MEGFTHEFNSFKDYYTKFLQELVRTESITGNETRAQDLVLQEMQRLGLEIHKIPALSHEIEDHEKNRYNLVGILKSTQGGTLCHSAREGERA